MGAADVCTEVVGDAVSLKALRPQMCCTFTWLQICNLLAHVGWLQQPAVCYRATPHPRRYVLAGREMALEARRLLMAALVACLGIFCSNAAQSYKVNLGGATVGGFGPWDGVEGFQVSYGAKPVTFWGRDATLQGPMEIYRTELSTWQQDGLFFTFDVSPGTKY